MERRNSEGSIEYRASGPRVEISGYSAVFKRSINILGLFSEEIAPEAFSSVLARSEDTVALFDHDSSFLLGRTRNKTLSLSQDGLGLHATIIPNLEVSWAKDVVESIKRGDIYGQSFAFTVAREEWNFSDDGEAHRTILEIGQLYDVGPVTSPAYPMTTVNVETLRSLLVDASAVGDTRNISGFVLRPGATELRGSKLEAETLEDLRTFVERERLTYYRAKNLKDRERLDLMSRELI